MANCTCCADCKAGSTIQIFDHQCPRPYRLRRQAIPTSPAKYATFMPANRAELGWPVRYAELISVFPRSRLCRVVITSAVLALASKPMTTRNLLSNTRSSLGFGASTSGFFGGAKTFTSFAANAGSAEKNATARIIFFKQFSCALFFLNASVQHESDGLRGDLRR